MKTKGFTKSMMTLVLVCICSLTAFAVSPKNYIYDTKTENGKVISKTVFSENQGFLSQEVKYDFVYDETDRVIQKKACKWNDTSRKWEPYYLMTYSYPEEGHNITCDYAVWDKKKKSYCLNCVTMEIPKESYDEIFS